ncbi:hypothetical protein D022_0059A, partial [Vibrio parahaemolyticus 12310]
MAGFFFVFG